MESKHTKKCPCVLDKIDLFHGLQQEFGNISLHLKKVGEKCGWGICFLMSYNLYYEFFIQYVRLLL